MWQEPRQQLPLKCTMEHLQPASQRGTPETATRLFMRRCAPQAPPQLRHPLLYFPPPPKHPPPRSAVGVVINSAMSEDHLLSIPGPSTSRQHHETPTWDMPNDYSYAYYEPGPPKKHTNVPCRYPGGRAHYKDGAYREGSYRSKHMYLTRYGTEENIYEEISEINRARMNAAAAQHQQSIMSLNQSLVEEELRRIQTGHRRVLGELNLSVEAMLMPSPREVSDDADRETDDQLADLLSVGPTDDLLSPMPQVDLDSGFSGSSSGASYRSAGGSLRRANEKVRINNGPKSVSDSGTPIKGFWSRKGWKKLAGISNNAHASTRQQQPQLQSDEPRLHSGVWEQTPCERKEASSLLHPRTLQHSISQKSSEDSWCSGSDVELSSDEESDRSAASSTRGNGQLRSTLHKARTLCDKWRNSGGLGNSNRLSLDITPQSLDPSQNVNSPGRLSRWFSIRRNSANQYDLENTDLQRQSPNSNKMPLLPEMEEEAFANSFLQQRRQLPPTLPSPPLNLTPQQLKRRMIVAAIVHSENSYVATLQRLVSDYKKPLEESSPPILGSSKISTLFHRLPEILQCHTLFRIALAESIRNWDRDEKIGDVFVASFSKAIVLDIYSDFINNFSIAMDLAKMESKRKSALSDFLKVKQISSHDRLSFFGLMVKPVQRFPQFILFLQDLLKHTPQGHHDRMSLQLALTQLESLAEMLNERKREAEQYQAFKEMLRNISGKFTARPLSDGNRYLLREDNATQLEFNQCGMITKSKRRRLLLLNDLIVCVSVAPKVSDDFGASERLSLKWTYPVSDVEIQDTSASPTLSRILTAGANRGGSLKSNSSFDNADNLCSEMSNLMHDYEVVSRITDLVGTLKGSYKELTVENTRRVLQQIQYSIQRKDEEMAWVDSCCLQLVCKTKGKDEIYTFQTESPSVKREWITELRLAQLALDINNSPAWEVPEQEQRPSTKMPLFVKSQCVYKSQHQTEVRCGCFYTVTSTKPTRRRSRTQSYLWICTSDGANSHITVLAQHQQQAGLLKDITSFSILESQITAIEYVKSAPDLVWMGTDTGRLILYTADEPEKQEEIGTYTVSDVVTQIKYHCDNVYVALRNGSLLIYKKNQSENVWLLNEPQVLELGNEPVSCLLPINSNLYTACGKKVCVLNGSTGEVQKSFSIQHEHVGNVNLMAHSGIGLWISLTNSSTICLYHTETFKHLQDINIASNVMRVTSNSPNSCCLNNNRSQVNVTALLACKGLLWVGTNVGISLTIPLPRLEGVPIISGRVNISYHAHFGPISFLLALQPKISCPAAPKVKIDPEIDACKSEPINDKQPDTSKLKHHLTNSPVILRRKRSKELDFRLSKTLPRGLGNVSSPFSASLSSSHGSGDTCDVYGLYGQLMYIKDYEGDEDVLSDPVYECLRRSDPDLAAIPGRVSTLDRRLKMKVSRPRSLDLSNWSVDSQSSSIYTSESEDGVLPTGIGNSAMQTTLNERETDVVEKVEPNIKVLQRTSNYENSRRTVITLMGGRGYINWRQPYCYSDKSKSLPLMRETNNNDAYIVIWELKL